MRVALTIAGSDSGAGAGIQADLLTFSACGVYGTTALTCLTAQNPDGVTQVSPVDPAFVVEQAEQVRRFYGIHALKTGMLFDAGIIAAVAAFLRDYPAIPAVVDPVMVASSGAKLLEDEAITALREDLLPRANLITPNLDEAAILLQRGLEAEDALPPAAAELANHYGAAVLLKGGHLPGGSLVDVLALPGEEARKIPLQRIDGVDTHGSGCTLSAAIAAFLARGEPLTSAVSRAQAYLNQTLRTGLEVGGRKFIAHNLGP